MVLREDCEIKLMSLCVCVSVWGGVVGLIVHTPLFVCMHACVSSTDLLCFLCSATHGARRSRRSFMTPAPNKD